MALSYTPDFALDPELTPGLRAELTDLWTAVSNAGGAVGFVPPVTAEQVRPTADQRESPQAMRF